MSNESTLFTPDELSIVRTREATLTRRATQLIEELNPAVDQRVAIELLGAALGLLTDRPDPLDLKIAAAAMMIAPRSRSL